MFTSKGIENKYSNSCTQEFIAALVTRAKKQRQYKCPSTYGDVIRTLTVNGFSFNFTKECDKCQIKYCDTLRIVRGKTVENLLHNIFKHCYNIHRMDLLGTTIRSWSNCFRDPYPINYNVIVFAIIILHGMVLHPVFMKNLHLYPCACGGNIIL